MDLPSHLKSQSSGKEEWQIQHIGIEAGANVHKGLEDNHMRLQTQDDNGFKEAKTCTVSRF